MMRVADAKVDSLAPTNPAAATISRRGLIAAVGAGSVGIAALNVGTNLLPGLRETSLLSPRGQSYGDGPTDFQINKTAESAGIKLETTGSSWQLQLRGRRLARVTLSRADLLAMEQRTERLPIACVEGWTTYQDWTGVQLRELAKMAGFGGQRRGPGRVAAGVRGLQVGDAQLGPDRRRALAARAQGQRRRPLARPRLPGPGDRPGAARRPQHEVGQQDDLPGGLSRCRPAATRASSRSSATSTGPRPCTCWRPSPASRVFAYALLRIFEIPSTAGILLWLGGAIVLHDFIALPLYSLLLRVSEEVTDAAVHPRRKALIALNHIRIPAAFSLLLLLISFPLVFQIDEPRYEITVGLDLDRYLGNWLLITAVLFAGSGLLLALKLRGERAERPMMTRESRRPPAADAEPGPGRRLARRAGGRGAARALGHGAGDLRRLRLLPALAAGPQRRSPAARRMPADRRR